MKRGRLIGYVGVGLVVCGLAGFWGWQSRFSPLSVKIAHSASDVPVKVYGLGTVEARTTSKIGFKIAGVIADLKADIGDKVRKGDVLARLDDREQRAQLARSEAAIRQAEANLQRSQAGVERAQANYNNARSINERRQTLLKSSNASVESAQTAQAGQDAALGDLNLAKSDVLVAEANIADTKAQRQLQTATLDFHTIVAPYDGLVTGRTKDLGATVNAGEPVFTLIDPRSVWVLAYIDESKAGDIRVDNRAEIVLRSQPDVRYPAKVARIEPESDRVNEERRIEVAFDQIPSNYSIGEQAEVYVTTATLPHALLVPETALIGVGRGPATAWTVENGRIAQRQVTLGHRLLDGRYEIRDGIPKTASVVTELVSGLRVGRPANIFRGSGR